MTVSLINSGLRTDLSLSDIVANQCAIIQADSDRRFMLDVAAWASGSRPGSFARLQEHLRDRRMIRLGYSRRGGARLVRILVVAEIHRIKRDRLAERARIAGDAVLLDAAE